MFCCFQVGNLKKPKTQGDYTDLSTFLNKADNGDLIFFCGNTPSENFLRWISNSEYSHVGFLFREIHPETKEDILYIYESDVGQGTKKGVRVIEASKKIKKYKGHNIFAWKKYLGKRPKLQDILLHINLNLHMDLDTEMMGWLLPFKVSEGVFCSELVAKILHNLDLIPPTNVVYTNFSPQDFLKDNLNYSSCQTFVKDAH